MRLIKRRIVVIGLLDHADGKAREFGLFYATVTSDIVEQIQLEPAEVSEVQWFKKSELQHLADNQSEMLIASSAQELWQSIFRNLDPLVAAHITEYQIG